MDVCFWTDLVNVDQKCGSVPASGLKIKVTNGYVPLDSGDITGEPPGWFDVLAPFTVSVGECIAEFVEDVGNNRLEVSGLPFCPGSGCEGDGVLTQGSNTVVVTIEIQCH